MIHPLFWALAVTMPAAVQAQFSFGGYNFPSSAAFADRAEAVGNSFILPSGASTVQAALTDINLGSWVVAAGFSDLVDVYFTNNVIVNGAGADFVAFEYATPEAYKVAVSSNGTPGGLGNFIRYSGTAEIDLTDFGIPPDGTVSLLRFQLNLMGGSAEGSADLQEVGALHSGDVPSLTDAFTFDDGTVQGWTLVGAYDETGSTLFSNCFTNGWKDPVNFPNPPGGDAAGNQHGSIQCFTLGGSCVTNPGHTWWIMQFHSPDLSTLPAWQSAKGYTVELAECMASLGTLSENLFVRVYDLDQAKDRYFYNGNAKTMQHDIYGDGTATWNHDSFDWSTISGFPTRYIIKEIFVCIWGKMNVALEGGVYLDQVVPILGEMPQVPAKPTNLAGHLLPDQIHVTWTDNSTDEDGFVLEKQDIQGFDPSWKSLDTLGANITSYQMDNPLMRHSYTFRIRAYNRHGLSEYSNSDTVSVLGLLVYLNIDSPNGGEVWNPGSSKTVTWHSSSIMKPAQVTLDYSIDGGSNWLTPAIATVANSGTYNWTVPNTPSANCILRVRDAADGSPYDLSNKSFTISTLTTPVLSVAPLLLDFALLEDSLSFDIRNNGGGTLSWNIAETPNKSWLTAVTPATGSGDQTVSVKVNRTSLTVGKDSTSLVITSNGGSQTVKVRIAKEAGSLPAEWNYTANTGQNAIVVLPVSANPNIEGVPILANDVIGAFTPAGLCCGWRQWQGANLSITIWGDNDQTPAIDGFKAGEAIAYRLYRLSAGKEWRNIQTAYTQGGGQYGANAFMVLSQFNIRERETMNLNLSSGWNMISVHVDPDQPAMDQVMAPLGNQLILIKNGGGKAYIPAYHINDIGNWNYRDGYQAYLSAAGNLEIIGQPVPPTTPIYLAAGWSLNSYLPASPINVAMAVASLSPHLVLVKNGAGQSYIPQYLINDIGSLRPGEGYQFYLNATDTLVYPAGVADLAAVSPRGLKKSGFETAHYTFTKNTGENAIIVVPVQAAPCYADGGLLLESDEIGVFDKRGRCCGAAIWQANNLAITVWGDDVMTDSTDGFTTGDSFRFRVWDHIHSLEYRAHVSFLPENPAIYAANGFSVISQLRADLLTGADEKESGATPAEFSIQRNFPNPFNTATSWVMAVPANGSVQFVIYDCRGRAVFSSTRPIACGIRTYRWDGLDAAGRPAASGLYFYQARYRRADGFEQVKYGKMILMK